MSILLITSIFNLRISTYKTVFHLFEHYEIIASDVLKSLPQRCARLWEIILQYIQ